jgi:Rieske Fe-S protein
MVDQGGVFIIKEFNMYSRRTFLKLFGFVSVCSYWNGLETTQTVWANVQPTTDIGLFQLNLDNFPALTKDYGSLRVNVAGMPASFPPIIITRLPGNEFHAVTSRCTHQGCAVNPYSQAAQSLMCPCHGSRFAADGKVLRSPATQPLPSYKINFDGNKTVSVEIPGLGYSVQITSVPAGSGATRWQLSFPTVIGAQYEVRFKNLLTDSSWSPAQFALTPEGPADQTVYPGDSAPATVYVEPAVATGYYTVIRS